MKTRQKQNLLAAALVSALAFTTTQAQQYPNPTTAAEVPGPMPGTAMTTAYVQTVGRMTYLWGWPLVNVANRAHAFSEAPEPGLLGGVVPVAFNRNAMLTGYISPEERFITCPNQDVVYGAGYFALDKEPVVVQVPAFGDRFWVYAIYDARTDEFSKIGKASPNKVRRHFDNQLKQVHEPVIEFLLGSGRVQRHPDGDIEVVPVTGNSEAGQAASP